MIHFITCIELKKVIPSIFFFKFNSYLFSTSTLAASRLDDGVPVTYFSGLPVLVLEPQTNLMTI